MTLEKLVRFRYRWRYKANYLHTCWITTVEWWHNAHTHIHTRQYVAISKWHPASSLTRSENQILTFYLRTLLEQMKCQLQWEKYWFNKRYKKFSGHISKGHLPTIWPERSTEHFMWCFGLIRMVNWLYSRPCSSAYSLGLWHK